MNKGFDRVGGFVAAYCLAAAVAVTCLVRIAPAQEEIPSPPPAGGRRGDVAEHPILAQLPNLSQAGDYLHHVLVNDKGDVIIHLTKLPQPGWMLQETCPNQTCCEEMLARIGVDQDHNVVDQPRASEINVHIDGESPNTRQTVVLNRVWVRPGEIIDSRAIRNSERRLKASQLFQPADEQHAASRTARFIRFGCPSATAGECTCAGEAICGGECAAAHGARCKGDESDCSGCPGQGDDAKCGDENCAVATMVIKHSEHDVDVAEFHPLKLMQHIAGLMAEKAAAEAALEVRKEADEQLGELYEAMAEVMADNAALDAKLEAHVEHRKLIEKISDLAAENARLKAHVELAAERAEVAKTAFAVTLENERLKLRLADLEQKHAALEAARTAAKPRPETK